MRWQQATIADIVARSSSVKSFFFTLAQPLDFRAGQHVILRLTAADGYRAQRSYSIASAPGAGETIELAIERLDDGEVSPFFHEVAAIGDEIELGGPIGGHFIWTADEGGPVLLIGAGSGVVPLVSIIRHRARLGDGTPMALLLSARTRDDVLFEQELTGLAQRSDGVHFAVTLTREPNGGGTGYARRIDGAMVGDIVALLPEVPRHVYVCGSNAFCEHAVDSALAAGIAAETIRTERYGG